MSEKDTTRDLRGKRVVLSGKFLQKAVGEYKKETSTVDDVTHSKMSAVYLLYDAPLAAALHGLGAKITASVSKKTDWVISDGESTKKLEKAKELGIQVLHQDELADLVAAILGLKTASVASSFTTQIESFVNDAKMVGKEILEYESDRDVSHYWPQMAIASYIGVPEDILGFFKTMNGWRFKWKTPQQNLWGAPFIGSLKHLLDGILSTCPKGVSAMEKHLEGSREKPFLSLPFDNGTSLLIKKGEYDGMVHTLNSPHNGHKLPFHSLKDYLEAMSEARGIPNWPLLLADDNDPIRRKAAKVGALHHEKAQKIFGFDAHGFREKWGKSKPIQLPK